MYKRRAIVLKFRFCTECGGKYIPKNGKQLTCSEECSRKRRARIEKEQRQDQNTRNRIRESRVPEGMNEILRECAKRGLSYGKYIQLRDAGML